MANQQNILASQLDYPLSPLGHDQAKSVAYGFRRLLASLHRDLSGIIVSPLLRARETARPFEELFGRTARIEELLIEQHLGRFSGMTYERLEHEPGYERDRTKRWNWIPSGGGESYHMLADRIERFFSQVVESGDAADDTLCVTHAVTMRMIYALLTNSVPDYPDWIPANGDIWEVEFIGLGSVHHIIVHRLGPEAAAQSRA